MAKDIEFPKEDQTEIKKKYKFFLACVKCGFKFSIESEEDNNTKIGLDKMKCPVCSKPVQLDTDMMSSSGKLSSESQSRMNIQASNEALRMASEMKRADAEEGRGKMIPVTSTQEGRSKGKTEMLPEGVVKSIEEKVAPAIEEVIEK